MRRTVDVLRWPVTVGRALDNDVVVDDPHVAARHLRILRRRDGATEVAALDTRNGVRAGRARLAAGDAAVLQPGAGLVQFGGTRLRIRHADETIAEEAPMREEASAAGTLAAFVALLAIWTAMRAIALDPGAKLVEWAAPLLGAPLGFLLWCISWGLASKLFQHRFEFWPHVAIAARGLVAATVVDVLLPQIGAGLGWAWLAKLDEIVVPLILATMVAAHASLVLPARRRTVGAVIGGLAVGSLAIGVVIAQHRFDRSFSELYMSTLPMPAFRLAHGKAPADFVAEADKLRPRLEQRVREAKEDDGDGGGDDTGDDSGE